MKIMLVATKEKTKNILQYHLGPLGFDLICYYHPIKAMDNIEEIAPDLVLYSAADFPRHWKPYLSLLRNLQSYEEAVFILLKGPVFPPEEAAKANHLGVNGVLDENFTSQADVDHLKELVLRYKNLRTPHQEAGHYIPHSHDSLDFVFTHPQTYKLITGSIQDIGKDGLTFRPDNTSLTAELTEDAVISIASLTVGSEILTISVLITHNTGVMALKYVDMDKNHINKIEKYIAESVARLLVS